MRLITALILFSWTLLVQADSDKLLREIIDEHWSWTLDQHPEMTTFRGEHTGNDRWTDRSKDALEARQRQR